jgi:hypothetical protein
MQRVRAALPRSLSPRAAAQWRFCGGGCVAGAGSAGRRLRSAAAVATVGNAVAEVEVGAKEDTGTGPPSVAQPAHGPFATSSSPPCAKALPPPLPPQTLPASQPQRSSRSQRAGPASGGDVDGGFHLPSEPGDEAAASSHPAASAAARASAAAASAAACAVSAALVAWESAASSAASAGLALEAASWYRSGRQLLQAVAQAGCEGVAAARAALGAPGGAGGGLALAAASARSCQPERRSPAACRGQRGRLCCSRRGGWAGGGASPGGRHSSGAKK